MYWKKNHGKVVKKNFETCSKNPFKGMEVVDLQQISNVEVPHNHVKMRAFISKMKFEVGVLCSSLHVGVLHLYESTKLRKSQSNVETV